MKLYADAPVLRLRQVTGDLLVLAWVIGWVLIGRFVHRVVSVLAAPGVTLENAGTSLQVGLLDIGESMSGVPLVGDQLQAPFEGAAGAAGSVADAGVGLQEGVAQVALILAVAIAAWPILAVAGRWVPGRVRFARRASAARRLVAAGTDLDLFALRALATLPLTALARISPDPAGDWRRGDPDVVRELAAVELRAVGLRLPALRAAAT